MTDRPDRIPCLVMGCRRTAPAHRYEPGTQIDRLPAHDHWPRPRARRLIAIHQRVWEKIATAAFEARAGIG